MQLRKRACMTAASALVSFVALAGLSIGPASAQEVKPVTHTLPASAPSCGASTFCMWNNINYTGTRWSYPYADYSHNSWIWVGGGANDQAASIYANREYSTGIAQNNPPGSGGTSCFVGPGGYSDLYGYRWPVTNAPVLFSISAIFLHSSRDSDCTAIHY
jgi:hypothetical protein